MSREIPVITQQEDEKVKVIVAVGYNFKDKYYYVTNTGTSDTKYITKRSTAEETYNVLEVVASETTSPLPTVKEIKALSTTYETLESLSYTWSDTGSYISTIQINDYKENPITLNAEKSKLYIMNSNTIYDLSLFEDNTVNRYEVIEGIRNYYYDILGVDLSLYFCKALYLLFLNYYNSVVYNEIETIEDSTENLVTLKYSNIFALNNFSKNSPVAYRVTTNPNNIFSNYFLGNVVQMQDKQITLTNSVTGINVGDTIHVGNAETNIDGTSYSSDGDYTITKIEDNVITVDENFPTTYIYQPPTVNYMAYKTNIQSINRATNEITLTNNVDAGFLVGDTITVSGTEIVTEVETLTVDGNYTIQSIGVQADGTINSKVIIVEEQPITNYTYTSGTRPYLYKGVKTADISEIINNNTIQIVTIPTIPLTNGSNIAIMYIDGTKIETTVSSISGTTITTTGTLINTTANYGTLNKLIPSEECLIDVTSTNYSDVFPTGEFMLDTYEECEGYIKLLYSKVTGEIMRSRITPTAETFENLNQYVPITKDITWVEKDLVPVTMQMDLLGLYSIVYADSQ